MQCVNHIVEEGQKGEACVFSRVGHVEQEVHGSENGSAETALQARLKKLPNQLHCVYDAPY